MVRLMECDSTGRRMPEEEMPSPTEVISLGKTFDDRSFSDRSVDDLSVEPLSVNDRSTDILSMDDLSLE